MATGYFSEGVCWAIAQEAIDAHFQSIPPTILQSATNTIYNFYQKQGSGAWNAVKITRSSTGVATNNYSVAESNPILISCTLPNDPYTQFMDGTLLGWGVATAMLASYLISKVIRGRP